MQRTLLDRLIECRYGFAVSLFGGGFVARFDGLAQRAQRGGASKAGALVFNCSRRAVRRREVLARLVAVRFSVWRARFSAEK